VLTARSHLIFLFYTGFGFDCKSVLEAILSDDKTYGLAAKINPAGSNIDLDSFFFQLF
jgi:hypothetical protein